jgi:hypothetical protein
VQGSRSIRGEEPIRCGTVPERRRLRPVNKGASAKARESTEDDVPQGAMADEGASPELEPITKRELKKCLEITDKYELG